MLRLLFLLFIFRISILFIAFVILWLAIFIFFDVELWRDKFPSTAKAIITTAVSLGICFYYGFDLFARIIDVSGGTTTTGMFLTGLVVSGGSAGARRLTQDFLKLSREHRDEFKRNFPKP